MASDLLKSTSTVGGMTLISRVLGFTRDILAAQFLGAVAGYDAFLVAFKIPNFFRSLFAEGAFSQAFVPLLAEHLKKDDPQALKDFLDKVTGTLGLITLIVTVLGMLGAPFVIKLFAPGFTDTHERAAIATQMLWITFPYLFFITMTGLAGSILNSYQRFMSTAFAPALLNISMILATVFASPFFKQPAEALAWGVFFGGAIQLSFQLPFLYKIGVMPRFKPSFKDPAIRALFKLILPAIFGASIVQINLLFSTAFASFLPVGSVVWLYSAERLMQFPLGVFGIALATVALPHLSRQAAGGDKQQYDRSVAWALHLGSLIAFPAAVGLFVLATPVLATLFQHGHFLAEDVSKTAEALQAYSVGIVAFIMIKLLSVAFYARKDIITPVKISALSLLINICLAYFLMQDYFHVGIAMANTISASINMFILLAVLFKKRTLSLSKTGLIKAAQILFALAAMLLALFYLKQPDSFWLGAAFRDKVLSLLFLLTASCVVYFSALAVTGVRWRAMRFEVNEV